MKRLRVAGHQLGTPIDDGAIRTRRTQLFQVVDGKAHERSKCKEFEMMGAFLISRPTLALRRASIFEATPEDVVDFLVFRDLAGTGRTTVHLPLCVDRSEVPSCGCPATRLSQSVVQASASKLRTRFFELGCAGKWSSATFTGNPANSALVERYTAAITEEQAKAGCVAVTARQRAMLPLKLQLLISRMRSSADVAYGLKNKTKYLCILRDIAWFTIQYRSLNRGAELSDLRVEHTALGPNQSCLLFQMTFAKTMRDGTSREFGVPALSGDVTCPVQAFLRYVRESERLFRWDWERNTGYPVFAVIDAKGRRGLIAITAGAMGQRFKKYLTNVDLDDSESVGVLESLHGLRAGGALYRALSGEDLTDIMLQGFWKKPETAMHYIGLLQEVIGADFQTALAEKGIVLKSIPRTGSVRSYLGSQCR
jgi:hypothetical protein